MSTTSLSPLGPAQLSFLPHAPSSPNPRPASLHRRTSGQSPSLSPKAVRPLSKSAPSSPSGRTSLPPGLAPLSMISPIVLDGTLSRPSPGYPGAAAAGPSTVQGVNGVNGLQAVNGSGRPGMVTMQSAPPAINGHGHPHGHATKSPKAHPSYFPPAPSAPHPSYPAPLPQQPQGVPLQHPQRPPGQHQFPNQINAIASSSRHPFPSHAPQSRSVSHTGAPAPAPAHAAPERARARSRPRTGSTSASDDNDTEVDSDSTFVPGRIRKASVSSPNLMALRNRLEGWAGDVARGQLEDQRRHRERDPRPGWPPGGSVPPPGAASTWANMPGMARRKTPPRPLHAISSQPLSAFPLPSRSPKSASSLGLRTSPSPRSSMIHMSSLTSLPSRPSSEALSAGLPAGGITGSEDADDDYDGDSYSSSGSLSFNAKARRHLRQRLSAGGERTKMGLHGGLGLSLGQLDGTATSIDQGGGEAKVEDSLFGLRLLAIFPAVWGGLVLLQALIMGGVWCDVYPWGIDTSREALDRLISGRVYVGTWGEVSRGDMALSIVWAALTGQFCFDLTTGLTHRWRIYYDLPATITRDLSNQCICQPLTGLTLWTLGPKRTLLAWVVIGCSTAWSRCVQMYVTSNIISPHVAGDVTPSASAGAAAANGIRRRSTPASRRGSGDDKSKEIDPMDAIGGTLGEGGLRRVWEEFSKDREWDWAAVAQEVGWKVGMLLLITNAWMFWGVEVGRWS